MRTPITLAALGTLLATLAPQTAQACGGFFCQQEPIDQSRERIVFAIDEDEERVDVHVQIFYQGSADEFSWVVPVPAAPDYALSTDQLFTQLEWQTAPRFNLEWQEEGDCEYGSWGLYESDAALGGGAPSADDADGAGGGVAVVDKGQVGPYEYVTLSATDQAELLTWLEDNDYDIPDQVGKALGPYVDDGQYFVALRLQSDRDVGDIAPIRLSYDGTTASIPIVLTSIAATPDMRIQPYVFSDGKRAVPDNYLHVQINEASIDWLSGGSNYADVVTEAADEAGGQAFATDYAGSTEPFRNLLWSEGRFDLEALAAAPGPISFVDMVMGQGFPSDSTMLNLFRTYIPMPTEAVDAGIDEQAFYNCLACYPEYVELIEDFDAAGFAAELDEFVVTPLFEAEQMFQDFDYLTRMTSSMSPDEMTVDPMFVLNPDMGDVDNNHLATLVFQCGDGLDISEAPRRIDLADGREILLPSERWFWDNGVSTSDYMAGVSDVAAIRIEATSGTGQPVLITDQSDADSDGLSIHNADVRDLMGLDDPEADVAAAGCACDSRGAPAGGFAMLGGLLGLMGLRRRS